jgi:molecular chaperone HtpG
MSAELRTTGVDLAGLLEVLGRNLYSTPEVAVRELVQNAHDSLTRRRIEGDLPAGASIRVFAEPGVLRIVDEGAGLTHDEVIEYLAVVGRGYTGVLRKQAGDDALIGAFGLGFLSAYVVSTRVEVTTCSHMAPSEAWRFRSTDGQRYSLEPAPERPVGTQVTLFLKDANQDLADREKLASLLRRWCALLPHPVFLGDGSAPVTEVPPWRLDPQPSALRLRTLRLTFAESFESWFEPVATLPVDGDGLCQGLLWIHGGSSFGNADNRDLRVYVRGMLVSRDERELLPSWATFIGGAIEADTLTPTASREDLQEDDTWRAVKGVIREKLIAGLEALARDEPAVWKRVLRRHNQQLRGSAIVDPRLFHLLGERLTVPTTEGELRLPAVLRRSRNRIYLRTDDTEGAQAVLCRALRAPILDGRLYAVLPFATAWAEQRGGEVILLGTQEGDAAIFPPARISTEDHALLEGLLGGTDIRLRASRFAPPTLPLVLAANADVRLKRDLEDDEANKRIGSALLGLARIYTKSVADQGASTMHVNMDSPVIQALLVHPAPEAAAALLRALGALMSGTDAKGGGEGVETALKSFNSATMALLTQEH